MISRLLDWFNREPSRPLSHCVDRSLGSVKLDAEPESIPALFIMANGSRTVIEMRRPAKIGQKLVGQYAVNEVAFTFHGKVVRVESSGADTWTWHVQFLLSTD
jgi:hypothetical protein